MPEAKTPRKRGRQTVHTPELAERVCNELKLGKTLRQACRDNPEFPPHPTILEWVLDNRDGFADQYARARELGFMAMAEEVLEISDDGSNDWMERENKDGSSMTVLNGEHVQRSRLRVETRKWLLSKALPKVYGDRLNLSGDGENGAITIHMVGGDGSL